MNKQREYEKYIIEILKALRKIQPKIVMVFGSYINKTLNENSDLDLLIVLDENRIPASYDEKIEMKLKIRKAIREINRKVAIDILVFTLHEYEEFMRSESSFSKEIRETGKVVYEKAS